MKLQMVDLKGQYDKIATEINAGIQNVIDTTTFINGPAVNTFANSLQNYLNVKHVIPCANGTDALQIALMALDLEPGDEVIVPAFTYVATAEVIALLKLKPVMTEVCPDTFVITPELFKKAITARTKAIVPVHLYGQCADMESILSIAKENNIYVIEDTAQALGSTYTCKDGSKHKAGTMSDIGCTSFFPSKNLGCYGDGGAMFTNNDDLAAKLKMIANHGQAKKYYHSVIGCNSRLDTIQAAILNVKLKHLDAYTAARNTAAAYYNKYLGQLDWLQTPMLCPDSTHGYHQYTIKLRNAEDRDLLKQHLESHGIPSMIYYPLPLHFQEAFLSEDYPKGSLPVAEDLCTRVISLPIHTEMTEEQLALITNTVKNFKR